MSKEAPKTFEEANERIMAFIERLQEEGKSFEEAYEIAIRSYKIYSEHLFMMGNDSYMGKCDICGSAIIHPERYMYCVVNKVGQTLHADCENK